LRKPDGISHLFSITYTFAGNGCFIGTPRYWLWIGGIFSALEPLAFLGMAMYAVAMVKRGGRQHPNTLALQWTVGCAIMSAVGAGFLGFAHTLPQVNLYTHGTLVTAMHGHLAFWGAYAMIVLAMISYCLPLLTGRKLYETGAAAFAFWASNVGMVSMTGAFAVAGVTQVYLERRVGMDFLAVQNELAIHFFGLVLAAGLFTLGILAFVYTFSNNSSPSLIVTLTPTGCMMPWSKLGGMFQVYIKFLH